MATATLALLLSLALASFALGGSSNWIGPVGGRIASFLWKAFGAASWVIPLELGLVTFRLFRSQPALLGNATFASTVVFLLVGSALLHLCLSSPEALAATEPSRELQGGLFGEVLGEVAQSLMGLTGAILVLGALWLMTLLLRVPWSLFDMARAFWRGVQALRGGIVYLRDEMRERWQQARAQVEGLAWAGEDESLGGAEAPGREGKSRSKAATSAGRPSKRRSERDLSGAEGEAVPAIDSDALDWGEEETSPQHQAPRALKATESPSPGARQPTPPRPKAKGGARVHDEAEAPAARGGMSALPHAKGIALQAANAMPTSDEGEDEGIAFESLPANAGSKSAKDAERAPKIVLNKAPAAPPPIEDEEELPVAAAQSSDFVLPPTSLLREAPPMVHEASESRLRANAQRLVEKLAAFGVQGRVDEIHPGPVVTMYEFEPASGIKVSKIAGLADDLAMALAAQKVRIVAPIPGKARVGFELPNERRQTVHLREILEDGLWDKNQASLPMALGKDIAGQPVFGDLSKMPHLLVAGATGAGKSVGLNVMLVSLLAKKTPDEVRMLMIDPKVVELAVFDGIPHMLLPVVTDMKKAALALRWAVEEMERRYQLFAAVGARNIGSFNERVERVRRGELRREALISTRPLREGEEAPPSPSVDAQGLPIALPFVVVVVDEFADLMMVAAKDVESAIARLAQKARAAGIHVILATQRPSVDVITGMIKANFPARMAFKVSQREDSKTILGRSGAEHLLGMGDMLMIPPGTGDLKRVHCAYISEEEVKEVCDHLRRQAAPVYDESILRPRDEEGGGGGGGLEASDDPIYDRAVAVVADAGYCSISHIQRQLGVGYNKAAKLVERMEKEGVVGPPSGKAGGRREVLVQPM